nr:uncharacterized protein LOC112038880 [Quercus suber]
MRAQDPAVLFLAETWADEDRLEKLCDELHFDEKWVVPRETRAGGLALLWRNSVHIDVDSSSLNHIDVVVNKGKEDSWRFTGIYGIPEASRKCETWNLLRNLHRKYTLPWLCAGDFNEILVSYEKLGGAPRSEAAMREFREVVDDCGFMDLGYVGKKYSWRGRRGESMVLERLDRALATQSWLALNPATRVLCLRYNASDHYPIIINPEGIADRPCKPFRFEHMWLKENGCGETVKTAWLAPFPLSNSPLMHEKIKFCGEKLMEWSKHSFGSVKKQLEEKSKLLEKAEIEAAQGADLEAVRLLRMEVNELLDKESLMWQQRARALHLSCGDQNTRFFHNKASQRFRRNRIVGLLDETNSWCTDSAQVADIIVGFYTKLFTSERSSIDLGILEVVQPVVTEEMNTNLTRDFTKQEVDLALKEMAPLKAPGPDGMPPLFFQSFWPLIGDEVSKAVLDCLNSCHIPHEFNYTYVTLIPKVKNPEKISEFRPISLCNVIYKLISKVLANHLKPLLPSIVSENQSAFQAGRVITDNILMAFENLHYMKTQQTGSTGFMALKLDMSKAYDRVEWSFLDFLLRKMGFHSRWVDLMMECITTVSYSILINGEPSQTIHPSRGLRQGDPLSPYLFLLCTEGLHGLISKAATSGDIRGISICRNGPRLTHLFFADDSLIFCRASVQDCTHIQNLLAIYGEASGQQLNREKTTLFFSKNTDSEIQDSIKDLLGVPEIKQYDKYFGLPSFVGRRKKASLAYIKDRIWTKLQGWKQKLLSQAGREVLLKAVIQAIPTYSMSCFKLPTTLCHEIEIMIRKFWWGQRGDRRRIHWVKWRTLCRPKAIRGMGFRELQKFNDAMLAKQVWRLLQNQDSLFYRFFKSKYFPHGSIFDAKDNKGSFAWKSILKGRELITRGMKWRIGNGSQVRIFHDAWLPGSQLGRVHSPAPDSHANALVSSLINHVDRCWREAEIDSLFLPEEAAIIKTIPLSLFDQADLPFWPYTRDGLFSVKSGYHLSMEQDGTELTGTSIAGATSPCWKAIWRMHVPNRVKSLVWRAGNNALPTRVNLVRRHILTDSMCPECMNQPEDTMHALWSCPKLQDMWKVNFNKLVTDTSSCSSFDEILECASKGKSSFDLFAMLVSEVWQRRNRVRVGEPTVLLSQINSKAFSALQEFQQLRPTHTVIPRTARAVKWRPPTAPCVKVNFDGAVFSQDGLAGIGVIIRNEQGLVMAALSQQIPSPTSVEMVEVLAARQAVLFAKELGFDKVELEGDSESVTKAILGDYMDRSYIGHVLQDIKFLFSSFSVISVKHIYREGNCVAHKLARRAVNSPFLVWMESVPSDIFDVYQHDLLRMQ